MFVVVVAAVDVVDTAAVAVDRRDLTGMTRREQVGVYDGWSRDSLVYCRCRCPYHVHDFE